MDQEVVLLSLSYLHFKRMQKKIEKTNKSSRNQWVQEILKKEKKRETKRITLGDGSISLSKYC